MSGRRPQLVQINQTEVALLPFDKSGYREAKRLLTEASLDLRELSDAGRNQLRSFVKEYQRANFAG